MQILVTGGAGFIGSHLCERLLAEGHKVINLDNFCDFYDAKVKETNIRNCMDNSMYHLMRGDIRDEQLLAQLFEDHDIDAVAHIAAMAGVRPSIETPKLYSDVNITGTQNLLEACRKNNVKRFIFASSSSIYGNNSKVPFSEKDRVDHPISPYAATKKACELLCHTYHHLYDISMICLRFFTVYGPRQRPDLAIHKFTKLLSDGKELPLFGDGTTSRDYTYITDIIDGVTAAIDYTESGKHYEVINLGESKTISLKEMVSTLEEELGIKGSYKWLAMQPGDVMQTYADVSKAENLLNYHPQVSFKEGIASFIDWYKKNKSEE